MSLTKVIITSNYSNLQWIHTPDSMDQTQNIVNVFEFKPELGWELVIRRSEPGTLEEIVANFTHEVGYNLLNAY